MQKQKKIKGWRKSDIKVDSSEEMKNVKVKEKSWKKCNNNLGINKKKKS